MKYCELVQVWFIYCQISCLTLVPLGVHAYQRPPSSFIPSLFIASEVLIKQNIYPVPEVLNCNDFKPSTIFYICHGGLLQSKFSHSIYWFYFKPTYLLFSLWCASRFCSWFYSLHLFFLLLTLSFPIHLQTITSLQVTLNSTVFLYSTLYYHQSVDGS